MNGTEPTTPNAPHDPVDPAPVGPGAVDPTAETTPLEPAVAGSAPMPAPEQAPAPEPADGPGFAPPSAAPAAPSPTGPPARPEAPFATQRRRVRTGPIVWGSLILVLCAFVVQLSLAPGAVDPAVWISGTVLGLGVLLLGVSAGILARNARDRRRD